MRLPGLTCLHSWLRRLQSSCGHLAHELGNCLCFRWGCQHCCTCPTALKHQATAADSNTVLLSGAVALRLRHNAADAAACRGSQLAQLLLDGLHQQHTVVSKLRPRSHVPSEHWSCPHIFTTPSKNCLLNSSTLRKSDRVVPPACSAAAPAAALAAELQRALERRGAAAAEAHGAAQAALDALEFLCSSTLARGARRSQAWST